MLIELRVRDLGVIADLTLELGPGMTVLTGETGAGKTLLVQALQVVLGGRASSGIVRSEAAEALVEARFAGVTVRPFVDGDADGNQAERDPTEIETLLARAIASTGRSRGWIDGRMAPVATLVEAGSRLVDIHGQHDHQSLLSPAAQRHLLDRWAGSDLGPLQAARTELADIVRQLTELGGDERERARRADLLRYQVAEIDAAAIDDPDEDERLTAEEERLTNAGGLRAAAGKALAAIDGDESRTVDAAQRIGEAISILSTKTPLVPHGDRLRLLQAELVDVAGDLRGVVETWDDDPERLEDVNERRKLLSELRRKYGDTLQQVLDYGDEARQDLDLIERQAEIVAGLEARRTEAEAAVSAAQRALRALRATAAPGLAEQAEMRLRDLAMPDARLEIRVGEEGAGDAVSFLLGANRGEAVQPLTKVASGGELARTMLALRLVVGGGAPTMLFDEVDAGVGGSAALALARSLAEVAATRQVLVVTHLAQVAAFADHQVVVRKSVTPDGRTVAEAQMVDGDDRVVELSRMLSGHPDSATARAHAEELLEAGRALQVARRSAIAGTTRE